MVVNIYIYISLKASHQAFLGKFPSRGKSMKGQPPPNRGSAPQIHLDGEARWRPRRPFKGKTWNPTPVSSFKLYQLNWIIPLEFSCKVSPNGMKPFWGGLLGDPFLVNEVHARWIRARYYFVLVLFHVHTCNPVFKKKSRESNETWKDIIFF